jgi:hypothetical protein
MTWLGSLSGRVRTVQIYISPSCGRSGNRIELSSGTRIADQREVDDGGYEDGARLPSEPWRLPTTEEIALLVSAEPPREMARSVCIVKLPGRFSDARRDAIRQHDGQGLTIGALRSMNRICELGEPLACIGPTSNAANLKTVTVDREVGHYIGLHVDNWDGLDLDCRDRSTNRICVNVGRSDRYVLFLPIPVMEMARLLADEMGADWVPPERYTLIGRQFMERFPGLPAVRCRVAPGEAYIAPTENLVHDGSSDGQDKLDEQFTIRGHIRPRESDRLSIRHLWNKARCLLPGGR